MKQVLMDVKDGVATVVEAHYKGGTCVIGPPRVFPVDIPDGEYVAPVEFSIIERIVRWLGR